MGPLIAVPVPSQGKIRSRVIAVTSSNFRIGQAIIPSQQRSIAPFVAAQVDVKLFAQSHTRVQRPVPALEWSRWFAWYPVPIVIDGKLHYAWLQSVERKWGTSRYSGTIKWRYRLPARSRSR
jgi:hypothetical protein